MFKLLLTLTVLTGMSVANAFAGEYAVVCIGNPTKEFDQLVDEINQALAPVGALELELARQIAVTTWKLRRVETWEASLARQRASNGDKTTVSQLASIETQIREHRSSLRVLQKDPAADVPLIVRLGGMGDDEPVYWFELKHLYADWVATLPDGHAVPSLSDLSETVNATEPMQAPDKAVPEERESGRQGTAQNNVPGEHEDLPVRKVRKLVGEMAKIFGVTVLQLCRDVESRWRAGLQDERVSRRHRRSELRRAIKDLERQKQDLLLMNSIPDARQLDMLTRYEAAAQAARDKALKSFFELKDRRLKTAAGLNGRKKPRNE
jgi:hypothetical protein